MVLGSYHGSHPTVDGDTEVVSRTLLPRPRKLGLLVTHGRGPGLQNLTSSSMSEDSLRTILWHSVVVALGQDVLSVIEIRGRREELVWEGRSAYERPAQG